jgi:acid stress-induced BolA-like protein IbaG/YrbA
VDLVKKAKKLLSKAFPPPDKVRVEDDDGLIGTVVSARFRGLDAVDRQKMVWDALDEHLTPEERRRVVIVLTLTPLEEKATSANSRLN